MTIEKKQDANVKLVSVLKILVEDDFLEFHVELHVEFQKNKSINQAASYYLPCQGLRWTKCSEILTRKRRKEETK